MDGATFPGLVGAGAPRAAVGFGANESGEATMGEDDRVEELEERVARLEAELEAGMGQVRRVLRTVGGLLADDLLRADAEASTQPS